MAEVKFTEEESQLLIEEVAKFPQLFDINLESYKDCYVRDSIWKDISAKLNRSDVDCRRRWKYLRDSYNRIKRKTRNMTEPRAKRVNYKYDLYEKLQFLEQVLNTPSKTDLDSAVATTSLDNGSESQQKQSSFCPTRKRKRKSLQENSLDDSRKEDENRKDENGISDNVEIDDVVSTFAEHVKSVLKKLHVRLRIQAKNEIFNCLIKYQLIQLELDEKLLFRTNINQAHQLQGPGFPLLKPQPKD